MAGGGDNKAFRLWLLFDNTGSMGSYGRAVAKTLSELLPTMDIICGKSFHTHLIAFNDYSENEVLTERDGMDDVINYFKTVICDGGEDQSEATKSSLFRFLQKVDPNDNNIVWLITDSTPHIEHKMMSNTMMRDSPEDTHRFYILEQLNLASLEKHMEDEKAYVDDFDWLSLARRVANNARVAIFTPEGNRNAATIYGILGEFIVINKMMDEAEIFKDAFYTLAAQNETTTTLNKLIASYSCENEGDIPLDNGCVSPPEPMENHQELTDLVSKEMESITHTLHHGTDEDKEPIVDKLGKIIETNARWLMTNPILSKVWRFIASQRRKSERVAALCDRMSVICANDEEMKEWIDNSYDNSEEIHEMVQKSNSDQVYTVRMPDSVPFSKPSLRTTLNVLRGFPPPDEDANAYVMTALSSIEKAGSAGNTLLEIPDDLNDKDTFAMVISLIYPGILASFRASCILACLTHNSGSILRERAYHYLLANKGKWTGISEREQYPEVYSVQFILLLQQIPQELLTIDEKAFIDKGWYVWRFFRTLMSTITVKTAKPIKRGKLERKMDDKEQCKGCNTWRSQSIMVDRNLCAICHCQGSENVQSDPQASDAYSNMAQCRTCGREYAVERPHLLRSIPKCYYCRMMIDVPCKRCSKCKVERVHPMGGGDGDKEWHCSTCRNGDNDNAHEEDVPLQTLYEENPELMDALECTMALEDIYGPRKLSKVLDNKKGQDPQLPEHLVHNKLTVVDPKGTAERAQWAVRHNAITDLCSVCYMEKPLEGLGSSCGQCNNLMCGGCKGRWYTIQPGLLPVKRSQITCIFCKRFPKNKPFGKRNAPTSVVMEDGMVHGFCRLCKGIKPAFAEECGGDNMGNMSSNWMCEECSDNFNTAHHKACPECGTLVEKKGGCDHIACYCGNHWCFVCQRSFDHEVIYDHMIDEHGSVGIE